MQCSSSKMIAGVFTIFLFSSCIKNDISRNTQFLILKSWTFEAHGLDENNNGRIDASENSMLSCESDDRFTFMVSGSGFYERNKLPCYLIEPDIINFTWSFSNNETELTIFAAPEFISQLDNDVLELFYMDVNSAGQPVRYIRRFRH